MYQIIYIDIDEEITAVIDKLRKSKTSQVFLAIPKRALILQSIISLKLLSREAEKSEKNIIIVTQDPREQKMAEKSGIETRSSLEGLDTEGEMKESIVPRIQDSSLLAKESPSLDSRQKKKIEHIGSEGFYDLPNSSPVAISKKPLSEISREESGGRNVKRGYFDSSSGIQEEAEFSNSSAVFEENKQKEDLLKKFFEENEKNREPSQDAEKKTEKINSFVSGKIIKITAVIFAVGILATGSAAAYLFVPKADVAVKTRVKVEEKDLDLRADSKLEKSDLTSSIVPARIIEKEESYSFSYPVTGKNKFQGQKAKGIIVIYNEFSSVPQSLVATTRFETSDKKIFRLVKGVTVPGMSEVGGKKEPGAIEAEVIADESGEEHNIEPTSFTIPGFQGGPKFEKFYAKSMEKMKGGSLAKEEGAVGALTQTDLAMAKAKSESQAEEKIKEELKKELAENDFLVESSMENAILESVSLSKTGDAVSEFQYRVKIKSKALVFSEADVAEIFSNIFQIGNDLKSQHPVELDFGAINADLGNGTATIKARGKMSYGSEVNVEKLKADLAGKNGEEIEQIIKKYPEILEIEVNVKPAFLFNKVPQMTSRIEISVN